MLDVGSRTIEDYILQLDAHGAVRADCECLMTVSISRFFRDRGLWQALEEHVLPPLFSKERKEIKVWSAGCACGEEAYSLKILWDMLKDQFDDVPRLHLLATDMNPLYLEKARQGSYQKSSLKEVSLEIQSRYFSSRKGRRLFEILPPLKQDISWVKHNLLEGPPDKGFQLILLRNNLLTYYDEEIKMPAFRKIAESLAVEGFLAIGSLEHLPSGGSGLEALGKSPYIFFKKGT